MQDSQDGGRDSIGVRIPANPGAIPAAFRRPPVAKELGK
jgi:hypothetical protein